MADSPTLEQLAERIDRLLLRHEELQRTNALLHAEIKALQGERDLLRSRLTAARARIDTLLDRLSPPGSPSTVPAPPPAPEGREPA